MRFCRFESDNVGRYGLIETVANQDVIRRTLDHLPTAASDFEHGTPVDIPLASARLLAPVSPSKIVCIGRNYREHAKELNHPIPTEPLIFLKPPSAVLDPGAPILRPTALSQRVDHEGELGVVIGKQRFLQVQFVAKQGHHVALVVGLLGGVGVGGGQRGG